MTRVALLLRKKLKGVDKVDVSEYPSAEEVTRGDASPPKIVKTFFEVLYGGPNPEKYSAKVDRHAELTSQDVISCQWRTHQTREAYFSWNCHQVNFWKPETH